MSWLGERSMVWEARELNRRHYGVLFELGLTPSAFDVLWLTGRGPERQADLTKRLHTTKANLSEVISRLCSRGLVTRIPSLDDGRNRIIAITPEGEAMVENAIGLLSAADE